MKRHTRWMGTCLLLIWGGLAPAAGVYSGGDGSWANPYQLATAEDIVELSRSPEDHDKDFIVTGDIDLEGYTFQQAVISTGSVGTFWGFTGRINGNGHVIKNLAITGAYDVGFIDELGESGRVYGLGIVDANVTGTGSNTGILVARNDGEISNCFVTGTVQGDSGVGGLVGTNMLGSITQCASLATVSGARYVGGLIGSALCLGSYHACYSTSVIEDTGDGTYSSHHGLANGCAPAGDSFWDSELSGLAGEGGLTTAQMTDPNTFLAAGWDFLGETENGPADTWMMPAGGGYPQLSLFAGHVPPRPHTEGVQLGRCTLSEDPNLVLWDGEDAFSLQWQATAQTQRLDTVGDSNLLSFTVDCDLEVLDSNRMVALDFDQALVCAVADADGRPLELVDPISPFAPRSKWRVFPSYPRSLPLAFQIAGDIAPLTEFARIDFVVFALAADRWTRVDLPLEPTADWLELLPGFRVKIEIVEAAEQQVTCTLRVEIEASSRMFTSLAKDALMDTGPGRFVRFIDVSDFDVVYDRQLLDADGQVIFWSGNQSSSGSSGSDGSTQSTLTLRGTTADLERVAAVRYVVLQKPFVRLVPLRLENVPLP